MSTQSNCVYCNHLLSPESIFCGKCGNKIPVNREERLIARYFKEGYPYQIIIQLLSSRDNIQMSERTLKRRLMALRLKRSAGGREVCAAAAIMQELQGPGALIGIRNVMAQSP